MRMRGDPGIGCNVNENYLYGAALYSGELMLSTDEVNHLLLYGYYAGIDDTRIKIQGSLATDTDTS